MFFSSVKCLCLLPTWGDLKKIKWLPKNWRFLSLNILKKSNDCNTSSKYLSWICISELIYAFLLCRKFWVYIVYIFLCIYFKNNILKGFSQPEKFYDFFSYSTFLIHLEFTSVWGMQYGYKVVFSWYFFPHHLLNNPVFFLTYLWCLLYCLLYSHI